MTYPDTAVRAFVYRHPRKPSNGLINPDGAWIAEAFVSPVADYEDEGVIEYKATMPEALARVAELRRELEAKLMDEVHASRASRRAKANPDIVTTGEPA